MARYLICLGKAHIQNYYIKNQDEYTRRFMQILSMIEVNIYQRFEKIKTNTQKNVIKMMN